MNQDKYIFSQLTEFLPRRMTARDSLSALMYTKYTLKCGLHFVRQRQHEIQEDFIQIPPTGQKGSNTNKSSDWKGIIRKRATPKAEKDQVF